MRLAVFGKPSVEIPDASHEKNSHSDFQPNPEIEAMLDQVPPEAFKPMEEYWEGVLMDKLRRRNATIDGNREVIDVNRFYDSFLPIAWRRWSTEPQPTSSKDYRKIMTRCLRMDVADTVR